ncbi:MAG: hypothetical protein M0Z51_10925 [Propionibacterium sp.]|nr:hypothetical protein [Propionibacterium sp.]
MTATWTPALVTLGVALTVLLAGTTVAGAVGALRRAHARRRMACSGAVGSRRPDPTDGHRPIVFSVPTDSARFLDGVAAAVPAPRDTPMLLRRLYLSARDDGSLTYAVGTRIRTGLTYLIVTTSTESGCVGQAGVARWTDPDGLESATDDVALIDEHVLTTIESLGGSYRL